jgi:hypothetical protein
MKKWLKNTLIITGGILGLIILLFIGMVIYYIVVESLEDPSRQHNQERLLCDIKSKYYSAGSHSYNTVIPSTGEIVSKMFIGSGRGNDLRFRIEEVRNGEDYILISNYDGVYEYLPEKNVAYHTENKTSEESAENFSCSYEEFQKLDYRITGEEIVNGEECYLVEFTYDGENITNCVSKDTGQKLDLRIYGEVLWYYKDYKFGLEESLFEIPSGIEIIEDPLRFNYSKQTTIYLPNS